jgi:Mn2+/Fe2+ NRAMP family transporter
MAAAARKDGGDMPLGTVGQIAAALRPVLGAAGARVVFGAGMLRAALVAALVASLAGAWGLAEISGWDHTLNRRPGRATAGFYLVYVLAHVVGAAVVLSSADLVGLVVGAEVMNALLLPVVLGFLLALEATALRPASGCAAGTSTRPGSCAWRSSPSACP